MPSDSARGERAQAGRLTQHRRFNCAAQIAGSGPLGLTAATISALGYGSTVPCFTRPWSQRRARHDPDGTTAYGGRAAGACRRAQTRARNRCPRRMARIRLRPPAAARCRCWLDGATLGTWTSMNMTASSAGRGRCSTATPDLAATDTPSPAAATHSAPSSPSPVTTPGTQARQKSVMQCRRKNHAAACGDRECPDLRGREMVRPRRLRICVEKRSIRPRLGRRRLVVEAGREVRTYDKLPRCESGYRWQRMLAADLIRLSRGDYY